MRREDGSLRRSAVKRPAVTGHGDDLDACRARRHAGSIEKLGDADPRPDLLAPPAARAIEDHARFTTRQLGDIGVRELGGSGYGTAYAQAPCRDVDRGHRVEAPDGHREGVAGEGAGMSRSGEAPSESDAVEREGERERCREEADPAYRRAAAGERHERGPRLAADERVYDDERAEGETAHDVEVQRRVQERPVEGDDSRGPGQTKPRRRERRHPGRETHQDSGAADPTPAKRAARDRVLPDERQDKGYAGDAMSDVKPGRLGFGQEPRDDPGREQRGDRGEEHQVREPPRHTAPMLIGGTGKLARWQSAIFLS